MNQFIILLASNSDAEINIALARKRLSLIFLKNIRFSKNHWSEAVNINKGGYAVPQREYAKYLNAVCVIQSEMSIGEIQVFLKKTESDLGRHRSARSQERVVIDIDLVEWNNIVLRPKDADQDYYKTCLLDL